jgi:hypothetical protein
MTKFIDRNNQRLRRFQLFGTDFFYTGGNPMVEVTEMATKQIADYFKDKAVMPIRIFLNEGG